MEVLDTTIANVALRYIAGGLSAADIDSDWVITSYLAANAIVLPITGWLSAHLGRRNYFLLSIAVFTLASALCGLATSLGQMILFRVIQGLAGGGLQPCSQGVLLDSFPPEKQGTAMTLFGVAALIGADRRPDAGRLALRQLRLALDLPHQRPDRRSWRCSPCYVVVEDPDYLKQERAELRRQPLNFDYIGLGLLRWSCPAGKSCSARDRSGTGWGDPFGRVQTLFILFVLGLGAADLPGDADRQPDHQLPGARRAQPRGLLRHHVLRLRRALRRQHRRCRGCSSRCSATTPTLRAGDVAVGRLLAGGDGASSASCWAGASTPAG